MKYFSEITNKAYDSEKECLKAEKEFNDKLAVEKRKKDEITAARKAAAHDVEEKLKAASEANKAYREALSDFCKNYGSYHYSVKGDDITDIFKFWDMFF